MRYCVHLLPAPILLLRPQYHQSLLIYLERVYQIERNKFKFNGEENGIAEQPSIQSPFETTKVLASESIRTEDTRSLTIAERLRNAVALKIKKLNSYVARSDKLGGNATTFLKGLLFERGLFRYSMKHVCHYIACCGFCRNMKANKRKSNFYRSHLLYSTGEQML